MQNTIKDFADIRGHAIAVDAVNTAYALQAKKILLQHGLSAGKDYTLNPVGNGTFRLRAMVDDKNNVGAILNLPFSLEAAADGMHSLGRTTDLLGPYQAGGNYVRRAWARDNAATLQNYLAAFVEALRWSLDPQNHAAAVAILVDKLKLTQAMAEKSLDADGRARVRFRPRRQIRSRRIQKRAGVARRGRGRQTGRSATLYRPVLLRPRHEIGEPVGALMPAAYPEEAQNFRLLGHDPSAAWGGGSLVQVHKGHAYVGAVGGSSFNGPEGFTVHDVRDPRKPAKVGEFRAPPGVHCHKLRIVGDDLLYVNSERLPGDKGKNARAGFFIFDISKPATPKPIGFYDMPGSGPHRFGVDLKRELAFMPNDAPGWNKRVIWTLDIKDPLKPEVVSIWGLPWIKTNSDEVGNDPMPAEEATTLHGPPMIRGNRMYCAWWGGGMAIIDCTDLRAMKLVGHIKWSPPFPGSTHTCWPIGDRPYLVVTDEARGKQKFWDAQFMWIIDARDETNPLPIATFMPEREKYYERPGRFGAHNILEDLPAEGPWKDTVFLTYFNAGLRAVNVSDPLHPEGSRLLRAGNAGRRARHPVKRHRRRRRRPALPHRPLGPGHAYSGIYRVADFYALPRRHGHTGPFQPEHDDEKYVHCGDRRDDGRRRMCERADLSVPSDHHAGGICGGRAVGHDRPHHGGSYEGVAGTAGDRRERHRRGRFARGGDEARVRRPTAIRW